MEFPDPFSLEGIWLKGNTHTHTTESDGAFSPEDTVREYGKLDYDFVFITDHRKRTAPPVPSVDGTLMLGGEEIDLAFGHCSYHVVILGADQSIYKQSYESLNEVIRMANTAGGLVIMAHPYWLGARSEEYLNLDPFLGVEVFNTVCDAIAKGYSAVHWDDMLQAGRRVLGFAADDFHNPNYGMGRGYIMVKAAEKSEAAILDAIRNGYFYSTQGPEIKSVTVEGDDIHVECSPCRRINIIANRYNGHVVKATDTDLTEGEWKNAKGWLIPTTYFRIECVDAQGRIAWSNPIYRQP